MKESQLRCIKLLEEENMALRAQLKEIHGAVAKLMRQKTDGSKDLPFFSEANLYRDRAEKYREALRQLEGCVGYSDTSQCWVLLGRDRTMQALRVARELLQQAAEPLQCIEPELAWSEAVSCHGPLDDPRIRR